MKYFLMVVLLGFVLASCDDQSPDSPFALYENPTGLDFTGFDQSTRPQDNIYQYVNGNWLKNTEIPSDQSSTGVLSGLRDIRDNRVNEFLTFYSLNQTYQDGSNEQILGDLFYSLTQDSLVAGKGFGPIEHILNEIENIKNKEQLEQFIAKQMMTNIRIPFSFEVRADFNDSSKYIFSIFQSGLGLPSRDYYLSEDQEFEEIRAEYKRYLRSLLELANTERAEDVAKNAYEIEALLAEGQWPGAERRDPVKITNHYRPDDLYKLTDKLDWSIYLRSLGIEDEEVINVSELSFFVAVGEILTTQPLNAWKDYLRIRALDAFARYLEDGIRNTYYSFHDGFLRGADENRSRRQIAVFTINNLVGDAVGKIYAQKYFPASSKEKMETLVKNLKSAFKNRIQNNAWMSDQTKQKALVKLDNLLTEIGYPEEWTDYSSLKIERETPIQNVQNIYSFYYSNNLRKLGRQVKRNEWKLPPHVVNANFLPFVNAMFYPAGFLEPPYFNSHADDAVNYAGIGVIIGHEIGHAFDDQGRQFGPTGTLEDWWTEKDLENFKKESEALVGLFNNYSPVEGMTIDGQLTLGENISDLVGVQIAYDAYIASLNGQDAPIIDGLTGRQRFFLGYAQSLRSKTKEETLQQWLVSDPHSPDEYRVNGILPHIPAFYEVFGVKEGDGMYLAPEDRVDIW